MVRIDDIVFRQEYYPRSESDRSVIVSYVMSVDELPPIVVNRNMVLIDGFHRMAAYRQVGRTEIPAEVVDIPDDRVFEEAVRLNSRHGRGLSPEEKIAIAKRLYMSGKTQTEIADILSVTQQTVSNWVEDIRGQELKKKYKTVFEMHRSQPEMTQAEIAERVGLSQQRVSQILRREDDIVRDFLGVEEDTPISDDNRPEYYRYPFDKFSAFNLWYFPKKTSDHTAIHRHGVVDRTVVEHILYYFSEPEDLVIDPMAGMGEFGEICESMGRRWLMYDIAPVHSKVKKNDLLQGLPEEAHGCDLIYLDPPYFECKVPGLFGGDEERFYDFIKRIVDNSVRALRIGGHIALVMCTLSRGGRFYPLTFRCWEIMYRHPELRMVNCITSPLPPYTGNRFYAYLEQLRIRKVMIGRDRSILVFQKVGEGQTNDRWMGVMADENEVERTITGMCGDDTAA